MPRIAYTFRGHIAPALTPLLNDGAKSLNLSIIPQYAKFLADRGITGVLVNGTTGEGQAMSIPERKAVVEAWREAVKSTKQHLMIQVGGAPLPDVLELAKHAEGIGADSLLCLPELYFRPKTPKELVDYLQVVGQAAPKTPLLYYHYPENSKVDVNMVQFLESVGDRIPTFVGLKFTSNKLEEAAQAMDVNNNEFTVFLGTRQVIEGEFASRLAYGISIILNGFPEWGAEITKASTSGNKAEAEAMQEKLGKAMAAIFNYGNLVESMKIAMRVLTPFDFGPARFPLTPISADGVKKIEEGLAALGYSVKK